MNVKKASLLILLVKITTVICNGRSNTEKYYVKEKGISCIKCNIGEYVVDHCAEDLGYPTCKPCEENEYVSDGGSTSCATCTDCIRQDSKTEVYIPCTKSEDTVCVCPDDQIFKDGYCQQCQKNYVVYRTKSDVNGKCVKCESGSFYNNVNKTCSPCSSCADDEDIVSVCEGGQDIQCKVKENTLSSGEIAGITVAAIIIIIIIIIIVFVVYKYMKKRKKGKQTTSSKNRPVWIEPLITILINELEDYASYFHKLDDLTNFNCRTRLRHLDNQYHREAPQVIRNFVYEYQQADSDTVKPQTFATALEKDGLNATVNTMRADPILRSYLDNHTVNEQNSDTMPLTPNQSTSQQSRLPSNDNEDAIPLINNQSVSQPSRLPPNDSDAIPYIDA